MHAPGEPCGASEHACWVDDGCRPLMWSYPDCGHDDPACMAAWEADMETLINALPDSTLFRTMEACRNEHDDRSHDDHSRGCSSGHEDASKCSSIGDDCYAPGDEMPECRDGFHVEVRIFSESVCVRTHLTATAFCLQHHDPFNGDPNYICCGDVRVDTAATGESCGQCTDPAHNCHMCESTESDCDTPCYTAADQTTCEAAGDTWCPGAGRDRGCNCKSRRGIPSFQSRSLKCRCGQFKR